MKKVEQEFFKTIWRTPPATIRVAIRAGRSGLKKLLVNTFFTNVVSNIHVL